MPRKKETSHRFTVRITPKGKRYKRSRRVSKKEMQPPYRERHLLQLDDFIKYCKRYGVDTNSDELEYFEEEALILPAVRFYYGVVEFRKVLADFRRNGKDEWRFVYKTDLKRIRKQYSVKQVDRKTYYSYDSLPRLVEGWLDDATRCGLVKLPSRQRFKPWKYHSLPPVAYSPDWRTFSNISVPFYTWFQMFLVQFIQSRRSLVFKNRALHMPPEMWAKIGKDMAGSVSDVSSKRLIQQRILEYYKVYNLLADIDPLIEKRLRAIERRLRKAEAFIKEIGGRSRLGERERKMATEHVDRRFRSRVVKLHEKHGFSLMDLDSWRMVFLRVGLFRAQDEPRHLVKVCITNVDDDLLAWTDDAYGAVYRLNWLVGLCGGRKEKIGDLILQQPRYRYCRYCGRAYIADRQDRKTCGSKECEKAHTRALVREGRKSGKYIYR